MLLAGSLWRKAFVTIVAAGAFVSLYEVTILDSRYAARQAAMQDPTAPPPPGVRLPFIATAYCKGLITSAGVAAQNGVAAADPALLPIGSLIDIDTPDGRYDGIYSVLDTGPAVQGREVDLYMWSCNEALQFGRRAVTLTVVRLGWNPRATTPRFMERFFKRPPPPSPAPLPARPLPIPSGS